MEHGDNFQQIVLLSYGVVKFVTITKIEPFYQRFDSFLAVIARALSCALTCVVVSLSFAD